MRVEYHGCIQGDSLVHDLLGLGNRLDEEDDRGVRFLLLRREEIRVVSLLK